MPSTYIVDPIFPEQEIHLVGGPSGSGKSTWMIQMLDDLDNKRPIFGYSPRTTPWTYVSCDRSPDGMDRTLDRISLPIDRSKFHSIEDIPGNLDIESVIKWCPTPLIVIEAMSLLIPTKSKGETVNSYQDVGRWLRMTGSLLRENNKTIIGTVHSPKMKENEKFLDKRQRVLGSVAFAAMVETIILVERNDSQDPDQGCRQIHLLPRNAPEVVHHYRLDARGRFVAMEAESDDSMVSLMETLFSKIKPGEEFENSEFGAEVIAMGVSKAWFYRWFRSLVESKRVSRVAHGRWRKVFAS